MTSLKTFLSFLQESWYYRSFKLGRLSIAEELELPLAEQLKHDRRRYRVLGYYVCIDGSGTSIRSCWYDHKGKEVALTKPVSRCYFDVISKFLFLNGPFLAVGVSIDLRELKVYYTVSAEGHMAATPYDISRWIGRLC